MEVTCQLRLNQLTKSGQAQIQLTYCWDGQRLRVGSGQKCLPKYWDSKRERVKDKPEAYAQDVNQVLDDHAAAALATYRAAQGQPLSKEQLRAGIEAHVQALRAGQGTLPPVPKAALTLLDYFDQWIAEEEQKVSVRTGRKLSSDTIWTHRAVRKELADFAAHSRQPLSFEGLTKAFYDGLRNYMLGVAGRSPRTFNTYVKRLRSFLFWAESQLLPVPAGFRKVLRLSPSYVGKDALTQDELLAIAAIDFASPAVQQHLSLAFPEPPPRVGRGGRGELTSEEHARRCEWTRDTFLLCAYTSLRHGDAQELGWQHVHPGQEFIEKQLNKTTVVGLIPYLDDDVFKPVALLEKYRPLGLATCLPFVRDPWLYLPHVAALARLTRLKLGMHVGRKTYATLKIYQGVPARLVMLATGHQTEAQFNVYLGINRQELLETHRQTARRLPQAA